MDRRARILDAARFLFEQGGYQATTTAQIAREAGIPEGSLFEYFRTKKELLFALLERDMAAYIDFLELHLRGIEGALNRIRKFIWSHLYTLREKRFVARFLLLEVRQDPDYYRSAAYGLVRRYSNLLHDLIQSGIKEGTIRPDVDSKMVRHLILGAIEQIALPWAAQGRPYDVDASVQELCRLVFRSIQSQGVTHEGSNPTEGR